MNSTLPDGSCGARVGLVTFGIPVTYFIEILRGIVLRGADFGDLIPSVIGLTMCGLMVLFLSVVRFQKRLR